MATSPAPHALTDDEWAPIELLLLTPLSRRGCPRQPSYRVLLEAIFYVLRTGCAWRLLPGDFPAWQTVSTLFAAGGWMEPGSGSTPRCANVSVTG